MFACYHQGTYFTLPLYAADIFRTRTKLALLPSHHDVAHLASCDFKSVVSSVLMSFWHSKGTRLVLNRIRMIVLPIYHAPDNGAFLRPPWAVCFPHLRIIAAQRGLLCSSICSFVASSSSFISAHQLVNVYLLSSGYTLPCVLPLRANLLLPSHHDVALASACSRHSGNDSH